MDFRLARPFPLYDPSLGDMGSLRSVIDANDYIKLANAYYRLRNDVTRGGKARPLRDAERIELHSLRRICRYQQKRLLECERSLGIFSLFRSPYFDDYPDAAPLAQKPR